MLDFFAALRAAKSGKIHLCTVIENVLDFLPPADRAIPHVYSL